VSILLARLDVNPDPADEDGQPPFFGTAKEEHEKMLKMLQERLDIYPNTADKDHQTAALLWAAQQEHEEVVNRLLERVDVEPHTVDNDGQTYMLHHHSSQLTVRDMREC